jgi:Helix-turn-helix domain
MAVFLNLRRWWESAELNQAEAAELLRVSERRFRSWMRRYEEEGEGPASSTAGSARRRASRSRATEPRRVERLYRGVTRASRSSLSPSVSARTAASAGATLGPSCICKWGGRRAEGAAQRGAPEEARAAPVAWHDAASGRLAPR